MQRRLGMFACTSDLTEGFKEKLRGVRRALEQQRACNLAVDAAVTKEVTATFEEFLIMARNAAEVWSFARDLAANLCRALAKSEHRLCT